MIIPTANKTLADQGFPARASQFRGRQSIENLSTILRSPLTLKQHNPSTDHQTDQPLHVLVQIGEMGTIGLFHVSESLQPKVKEDQTLVCRTGRGLEMGRCKRVFSRDALSDRAGHFEFSVSGNEIDTGFGETSGTVLRVATAEDELASERLKKHQNEAIQHCNQWIQDNGFSDLIVDTDVTLDGESIFFHFLGPMSDELNLKVDELVRQYDRIAKVKHFTQAVEIGCGPDCGSDGSGCSTGGSCSSCGLKSSCKK